MELEVARRIVDDAGIRIQTAISHLNAVANDQELREALDSGGDSPSRISRYKMVQNTLKAAEQRAQAGQRLLDTWPGREVLAR